MKTVKLFTTLFLAVALTFISCDKDDVESGTPGVIGETGATGPAGAPGQDGQDGQDGEDGQDGNANVIASEWIDSEFPNNLQSQVAQEQLDDRFTEEVLDNSVILTYGRADAQTDPNRSVIQLPFISNRRYFFSRIKIGSITFTGRRTNTEEQQNFNVFSAFRYIIIPQGTAKTDRENFKKMSYEQVVDHFGLKY